MLVALITVPLYLRYIGAERYGVLAVIMALLGYFGFIDLGLGQAVAQRMARFSGAEDTARSNLLWTALTSIFLLGLVGSLLLWFSAGYILTHLVVMSESSRNEAISALAWLLFALPLMLMVSVLRGALQARLRFLELNAIEVLGSSITQILPLAVAAMGHTNLQALVPAALASRLVAVSLLFWLCRRQVPLVGMPVIDRLHLKALLQYGGWFTVYALLQFVPNTVDRLFIATLSGANAVAHYIVPFTLASRVLVIGVSFSTALYPRLASATDDKATELALRATKLLIAIMTPIIVAGIMLVHPFLNLWVGEAFASASLGIAEIILVSVWIQSLAIPHQQRLFAADNPKIVAIVYLIDIPIYLFVLWLGVVHWGIVGAAIAWCVRISLDAVLQLYFSGALLHTLSFAIPDLVLVGTAALVALKTEVHSPIRWLLGVPLVALTLVRHKGYLTEGMNALRHKMA
jgi:O-antigen/teichoic acid export membrane protein